MSVLLGCQAAASGSAAFSAADARGDTITPLAITFVVARVLHGVFYLTDKHTLRSLSWLVGMLCAVGLMVLAAMRVA